MLTDNSRKLLEKRYFLEGENWEKLIARVVTSITRNRQTREKYALMMHDMRFLPNTPTLINAGKKNGQLAACFVLPIEDSIESIFDGVKHAALIHKSGGGTGFSFSRLREANAAVKSTNGISSGPVSFMSVYDSATGAIKQGGVRRGANMGILSISHPDILEFINCKHDRDKFNNFNISVSISNAFMDRVYEKADSDWELRSPATDSVFRSGHTANSLFRLLATHAHESGEPGVVFIDTINESNPTKNLGLIEATNPCGEQPLLPYEACVLGSINLARFVDGRTINWNLLEETSAYATVFLNDVINASVYPLPQIADMVHSTRKIGVGVMGWADMLAQLHVPYDSPEAISLAKDVMSTIQDVTHMTSEEMAKTYGPYPASGDGVLTYNATTTTIAPTGSISMIADCSSSIEPYFSLAYTKTVMDGEEFKYFNPYMKKALEDAGFWDEKVEKAVLKTGSIQDIAGIPQDIKDVYKTALEIGYEQHIKMQATFQQYVDNAVSKTINMKKDATVDDVENAYLLAYKSKCKGITVYRDGSRTGQVLEAGYKIKRDKCPECGSKLEHVEGCVKCASCGWGVCE